MDPLKIILGLIMAIIIAGLAYKYSSLTKSGLAGTVIIGTVVFGIGGLAFAVPLLFFFFSGSLLSMIKTDLKSAALENIGKTGARDIWQVLANGGLAAVIVLVYLLTDDFLWYGVYLTVLAEATADTWGTEIGTLSIKKPRSIIGFRRIEPGQSGGVTLLGTAASLLGAIFLMVSGQVWLVSKFTELGVYSGWVVMVLIVIAGFIGSIFDSILGATVQGRYKCGVCGKITEKAIHCGQKAVIAGGFKLINNDAVNFLSTIISALLMLAFMGLFLL
jgi:uncharacterized protein (TIGR00297 family)